MYNFTVNILFTPKTESDMKIKIALMTLLISLFSWLPAFSESSSSETIPVDKEPEENPTNKGKRMPAVRLLCTISEETGVIIPGVEKDSILSFEAYDEDGCCLASFGDESSFVEFFFSELNDAIVYVRFVTSECAYRGYIY